MQTPVEQRRRELGLTQVDLATAVGASQPTISAIEKGRIPKLSLAYAIAKALDSTPEDLFPREVEVAS